MNLLGEAGLPGEAREAEDARQAELRRLEAIRQQEIAAEASKQKPELMTLASTMLTLGAMLDVRATQQYKARLAEARCRKGRPLPTDICAPVPR